ncbi:MAG: hypothetical protein R3E62_06995 [Pseudomonadales bacterium]|jgi:hypothetical protein
MKILNKFFAMASLMFIANTGHSADYLITVCSLQASDDGRAYLSPCGGWTSQNNCPASDFITWSLDTNAGKAMYSSALAAFSADYEIKVRLNGSSCAFSYDVTSMIRITKN